MRSDDDSTLDAGEFSAWVAEIEAALRGERDANVPCNGCTACCTSSQFVHIGPDEVDTLAHIPSELLFPAPRAPRGNVLLGYDEQGHCPMLIDNRCSIYEHRPRTCRTYDCRIFPAAGLEPDGEHQVEIARRARRFEFRHSGADDVVRHDAVRAAARFLATHPEVHPDATVPNATGLAVLATEVHTLFIDRARGGGGGDGTVGLTIVDPDPEVVRAAIAALTT